MQSTNRSDAIPLCDATLGRHAARLGTPVYDRGALTPGVVHMSVGYFHRSHQAVYLDRLAELGETGWGVTGIGLHTTTMRDALVPQDCLYTVVERGADRDVARIVAVMRGYLFAPDDPGAAVDVLADPRTRLVTLTITAPAYAFDAPTGAFRPSAAEVPEDLGAPGATRSALGLLVTALARRRRAGTAPFTVLCCDNFPSSGDVARRAVVGYARLHDERLGDWIEAGVAFPNSMVDRITPRTTPEDRAFVADAFGIEDRWPVITEPFSEWLIEDRFCNDRPPLERVGASFVDDVGPYAVRKTRLLNAGHSALGFLGLLAGHRTTVDAMADPLFGRYVERLMVDEIAPGLPDAARANADGYCATLLERLSNPKLPDRLARLSRGGSTKVPCHVLPSIVEARSEGRDHRLLTLAVAAWCRFLRGHDERGRPLAVDDPRAADLRALALEGGDDPRPLLGDGTLFGALGGDEGFAAEVGAAMTALRNLGVRRAVGATLDATEPLVT